VVSSRLILLEWLPDATPLSSRQLWNPFSTRHNVGLASLCFLLHDDDTAGAQGRAVGSS
jgi:hypothetical protein